MIETGRKKRVRKRRSGNEGARVTGRAARDGRINPFPVLAHVAAGQVVLRANIQSIGSVGCAIGDDGVAVEENRRQHLIVWKGRDLFTAISTATYAM